MLLEEGVPEYGVVGLSSVRVKKDLVGQNELRGLLREDRCSKHDSSLSVISHIGGCRVCAGIGEVVGKSHTASFHAEISNPGYPNSYAGRHVWR